MGQRLPSSLRDRIGVRLRELRLLAGISSQEKLAERAGVHRTYVGRLERGETGVTVETLATILAAVPTSLSEFFEPSVRPIKLRTPRRRDTTP